MHPHWHQNFNLKQNIDIKDRLFNTTTFCLVMIAYMLVTCVPGNEKEVIGKIKDLSNVAEVNGVMGKYDVFVKIRADDAAKVDATISKVRNVPHVTGTITMPVIYGQGGTIDNE